jgi:hypothetical protein
MIKQKILFLIKTYTSNNFEKELKKIMFDYYSKYNVEFLFYEAKPDLTEDFVILGHDCYIKGEEGIENIKSHIYLFFKKFGNKYDFIYKTTLCCIPNIKLIENMCNKFYETSTDKQIICGPRFIGNGKYFCGGFGMLLNKNSINYVLENWNKSQKIYDDELISEILGIENMYITKYLSIHFNDGYYIFCTDIYNIKSKDINDVNKIFNNFIMVIKNSYKETKNTENLIDYHKFCIELMNKHS